MGAERRLKRLGPRGPPDRKAVPWSERFFGFRVPFPGNASGLPQNGRDGPGEEARSKLLRRTQVAEEPLAARTHHLAARAHDPALVPAGMESCHGFGDALDPPQGFAPHRLRQWSLMVR